MYTNLVDFYCKNKLLYGENILGLISKKILLIQYFLPNVQNKNMEAFAFQ